VFVRTPWAPSNIEQEITMAPEPAAAQRLDRWGEMLTPKEFAKLLKVSISWLAKARKRGDGPAFVRFGRSVRYFPLPMSE
jgi:Helix-turn-helix domain